MKNVLEVKVLSNSITDEPRDRNKVPTPSLKIPLIQKGKQLKHLPANSKEIKHNCPDSQTFDDKKGKCVFKSDKEDMNSNIDTNTSLQPNADAMQNKVQQVNKRAPQSVNDREVVGIKTKPFKRQNFGSTDPV